MLAPAPVHHKAGVPNAPGVFHPETPVGAGKTDRWTEGAWGNLLCLIALEHFDFYKAIVGLLRLGLVTRPNLNVAFHKWGIITISRQGSGTRTCAWITLLCRPWDGYVYYLCMSDFTLCSYLKYYFCHKSEYLAGHSFIVVAGCILSLEPVFTLHLPPL